MSDKMAWDLAEVMMLVDIATDIGGIPEIQAEQIRERCESIYGTKSSPVSSPWDSGQASEDDGTGLDSGFAGEG